MNYWLVKSEPSTWSWDQQVAKGAKGEAWTGVRNFTARQNLVAMKKGDKAFFYHSNEGKEIVGIAEIIKEAYPDPSDKTGKFVCVDIKADKPLKTPVTMAAIKADKKLADMALVKYSRRWACLRSMLASDFSDGSSVETQTYRKGHAHRPMESTIRTYAAAAVTTCASSASRLACVR